MKNNFLVVLLLSLSISSLEAQTVSGNVFYNNNLQPALVINLPGTIREVEASIIEKLEEAGFDMDKTTAFTASNNTSHDFHAFYNVLFSYVSPRIMDVYFKIIPDSVMHDKSTLFLLLSSGNENFLSADIDPVLWRDATTFLNTFLQKPSPYTVEQNITTEQNYLMGSQKKLANLLENEKQLAVKIRNYKLEILLLHGRQRTQQLDIDHVLRKLDALKSKRDL